jgi:hypothetical protein
VNGCAPIGDERVHGVEVTGSGVGEPSGDPLVQLVERPECARDDDQPSASAQTGREGAQDARRRKVARLGDCVHLVDGIGVRAHSRRRVREDDVDLAELGREGHDRLAVADVQDAPLDGGDPRAAADLIHGL